MSDLLQAALVHARRGIPVFPCEMFEPDANGKTKWPRTPHGFKDATTDEAQITAWWTQWPNAGIGMATGAAGFLVVDIDSYNGGDDSLKMLEDGHGPITAPRIATGGGGWHYYFRRDERFTQGAGHIRGIDFRGTTGYVIVPPSPHSSGRAYVGEIPDPTSVPPIPDWLAEALLTKKIEAAKVDDLKIVQVPQEMLDTIPPRIVEKMRTRATDDSKVEYEVACALAELGFDTDQIYTALQGSSIRAEDDAKLGRMDYYRKTIGKALNNPEVAPMREAMIGAQRLKAKVPKVTAAEPESEVVEDRKPKTKKSRKSKTAEEQVVQNEAAEEAAKELDEYMAELDARVATMTYDDVVARVKEHVYLPQPVLYDEILLLSNQTRLRDILPVDSVIFLAILGEYSAAKTYLTHIAVYFAGGKMIVDPTEAALNGELIATPQVTLGIDEVDELVKKYPHVSTLLRMGNSWNVVKPYRVPDGEGGWTNVDVNIGGPKFFNGYDAVDPALLSRTLKIDMERHKDIGMIVRKMERFPELEAARRWLELRCESALKTWTHERVSTLINSPEFQRQVHALTEAMTIPRNIEVVITILLLGRILDIDTRAVIENYTSAKEHLSQKTEVYKDVLADCYVHLLRTTVEPEDSPLEEIRSRFNEKREVQVTSTDLLTLMSERLFQKTRETIGSGQWRHVLTELGFSREKNWFKETRRNGWRQKYYLVFTPDILRRIGREQLPPVIATEPPKKPRSPPDGSVAGSVGSAGSATGPADPHPLPPARIDRLLQERVENRGNGTTPAIVKATEPAEPRCVCAENAHQHVGGVGKQARFCYFAGCHCDLGGSQ